MQKNIIKSALPFLMSLVLLATVIYFSSQKNVQANNNQQQPIDEAVKASASIDSKKMNPTEMRAVWVPFMTLNMKGTDFSEQAFKDKFDNIIKTSKEHHMNTLIVHVRSHGDSMYKSSYFPWSHLITGEQGKAPAFDPLEYMIKATHESGMAFHAWINPLRIQVNNTPEQISQSNLYYKYRSNETTSKFVADWENDKYLNPAYPEIRKLIIDGVIEVVKNYDVDGIHFDDYFYPTEDIKYDEISYNDYIRSVSQTEKPLSLKEWRVANINSLISGVYCAIKSINKNVVFGISPQGNIKNDDTMCADIKTWSSKDGYLDYICPQIYVNFENPVLPFAKAVDSWRNIVSNKNIKLYIGIGAYKAGSDVDDGTWKKSNDILMKQIEYTRKAKCDGFMFYSWEYLNSPQTQDEVANVVKILHN